jgi:putative peptide zinc metalloprotease protein
VEMSTVDVFIEVYPFTRQVDGDEIVIGRLDTAVFLALLPDAVELLDHLADGKTVKQAQLLYQEKYGEIPDMEDFLTLLQQKGLVYPKETNQHIDQPNIVTNRSYFFNVVEHLPNRFHFVNFPQTLAKQLFSRFALVFYSILILLAICAVALEPSIVPGWEAFFFRENITLMILSLTVLGYFTLFLHELAHLIAARAVGISSRLGISHRLWMVVAETDMTGIWSIPKSKRYVPFLAGPLLDMVSASIIIFILFGVHQHWITLPPIIFLLIRAILLSYLLRLLWQCYFFVRTDFYYIFANYFNCKNLMKDTENLLKNQIAKIIGSIPPVDLSSIPKAEMRVIRWYSCIWITGRLVAVGSLIFISIPLMYSYFIAIFHAISLGYRANIAAFIDTLVIGSLFCVHQGAGLYLWLRSLHTERR